MIQPNYEDPRIERLPLWAKTLIDSGEVAQQRATKLRDQLDEARRETDALRKEYAENKGEPDSTAWILQEDQDGDVVRFGLGTEAISFGSADDPDIFGVTFEDFGLKITAASSRFVIETSFGGEIKVRLP